MPPVTADTARMRACLQAVVTANEKLKLDCKVYPACQNTVHESATSSVQSSSSCAAVCNPALLLHSPWLMPLVCWIQRLQHHSQEASQQINGLMQQLRLADAENRTLQDEIDSKRHGTDSLCFSLRGLNFLPELAMHSCLLRLLLVTQESEIAGWTTCLQGKLSGAHDRDGTAVLQLCSSRGLMCPIPSYSTAIVLF